MRRKKMLLCGVAGVVAAGLIAFGGDIVSIYSAAYPLDIAKRDALAVCAARDHLFVRFSATDRAACYHWALGRT